MFAGKTLPRYFRARVEIVSNFLFWLQHQLYLTNYAPSQNSPLQNLHSCSDHHSLDFNTSLVSKCSLDISIFHWIAVAYHNPKDVLYAQYQGRKCLYTFLESMSPDLDGKFSLLYQVFQDRHHSRVYRTV